MTGINIFNSEIGAKAARACFCDLLPGAARISVLVNPADATLTEPELKQVTNAARAMGLQIQVHNAEWLGNSMNGRARLWASKPEPNEI